MITKEPKKILVFNSLKRFVGFFRSERAAAKAFGTYPQSIHYSATGKCVSCCGHYFRVLPESLDLTLEQCLSLDLLNFDKMCGVERKLYPNGRMERKGMKYKTGKGSA